MIRITPAGALTATSYPLTYEIIEKLCKPYCTSNPPIASVTWNVSDQRVVGTTVYATLQAVVTVACPQGGCSKVYTEEVVVSGTGTAITVASTPGYTEAAYMNGSCCKAGGVRAVGTVTVTITPAA